jgi:hypothetical protein
MRGGPSSRAERLQEKAAYHTVAEIPMGATADAAYAGIKSTGLEIALPNGLTLHYDLESRLTRAATPNVQWRRGLSHQTVWLRKRSAEEGGGLATKLLNEARTDRVVDDVCVFSREALTNWRESARCLLKFDGEERQARELMDRWLERAAAFDSAAARADLDRFRAVYGGIPILPPDQYRALVLLATDGCAYNRCTFCGFYREVQYRRRTADHFRSHVQDVLAYHGKALANRRGVFLGQANALTGPRTWREDVLRATNEQLAGLGCESRRTRDKQGEVAIASFVDAFTGRKMSADEFRKLRALNLRQLYLGIETGDRQLLEWLEKPATTSQMLDAVISAKSGDLNVGILLLVGVGGEKYFESHVRSTAELLRAMPLGQGDYIYLSPITDAPHAEYANRCAAAGIEPLSPQRVAEQTAMLRDVYGAVPRRQRPYIAHYEVEQFVY